MSWEQFTSIRQQETVGLNAVTKHAGHFYLVCLLDCLVSSRQMLWLHFNLEQADLKHMRSTPHSAFSVSAIVLNFHSGDTRTEIERERESVCAEREGNVNMNCSSTSCRFGRGLFNH